MQLIYIFIMTMAFIDFVSLLSHIPFEFDSRLSRSNDKLTIYNPEGCTLNDKKNEAPNMSIHF